MERFASWAAEEGLPDALIAHIEHGDVFDEFQKTVVEQIKSEHEKHPKYRFETRSADQVLQDNLVEVIPIHAEYALNEKQGHSRIIFNGTTFSVEEFAAEYFRAKGFEALDLESTPFHIIFAVYMWPLIQSPLDTSSRLAGFGDREAFERKEPGKQIWLRLPDDFGTSGFAERRASAIDEHLSLLPDNKLELLELFDLWIEPSGDLRQYLWAHKVDDVIRARKVVEVLPEGITIKILRYLVGNYWGRYLGWPDLLVFRSNEFLLVEVKSSGDKLRENQKDWIEDNRRILKLPFKLVKIHRKNPHSSGAEN